MKKEKVNWKKEYQRDNLFNIVNTVVIIGAVFKGITILFLICVFASLLINLPVLRFFYSGEYE